MYILFAYSSPPFLIVYQKIGDTVFCVSYLYTISRLAGGFYYRQKVFICGLRIGQLKNYGA